VSTAVARGDEIIREPAGREYGARLRNLNLTKNDFPNSDIDAPSRQLTYKWNDCITVYFKRNLLQYREISGTYS